MIQVLFCLGNVSQFIFTAGSNYASATFLVTRLMIMVEIIQFATLLPHGTLVGSVANIVTLNNTVLPHVVTNATSSVLPTLTNVTTRLYTI